MKTPFIGKQFRAAAVSFLLSSILLASSFLVACSGSNSDSGPTTLSVAVFVPGVVQGSPTYEMMVEGVKKAVLSASESGKTIEYKIVEGGYNQGEWQAGVTALASTREYDLIVTSNPSMPDIAAAVAKDFPEQRFLVLDGFLEGNPAIKTVAFNQYEQAYVNGYFAALVSSSNLAQANDTPILGLLAGQEYPVMNDQIRPGFLAGAKKVNPAFEVDFRVLGNWYDAAKADEIARSMIASGSDVILTIAGGANQGVVSAAQEAGAYVTWFDSPGTALAPGIVIGGTVVRQAEACTEAILKALSGTLDYGTSTNLGVREGAVAFDFESPELSAHVPAEIVEAQRALIADIVSGMTTAGQ